MKVRSFQPLKSLLVLFVIGSSLFIDSIGTAQQKKLTPKELEKTKTVTPLKVKGLRGEVVIEICPGQTVKIAPTAEFESEGDLSVKVDGGVASAFYQKEEGRRGRRYVIIKAGDNPTPGPLITKVEVTTETGQLGGIPETEQEGKFYSTKTAFVNVTVIVLPKTHPKCAEPAKTTTGKTPPPPVIPEKKKGFDVGAALIKQICVNDVLYLDPVADIDNPRAKSYKVESDDPSIASGKFYVHRDKDGNPTNKPPKLVVVGKAPGTITIRVDVTPPVEPKEDETINNYVVYLIKVVTCTGPTAPKEVVIEPGAGYKELPGDTVTPLPPMPEVVKETEEGDKSEEEKKTEKRPPYSEDSSFAPEAKTVSTLVGLVVPADARAGEEVSGSVVTDPKRYENVPGLKVFETEAPLRQVGGQATLTGLVVDTPEEEPQRAEERIRFRIPENATQIVFTLLRTDNPTFRVPGSSPLSSRPLMTRGERTPVVSRGEPVPGGSVGGECCSHLGKQVNCPSGLPAGSESLQFVEGGAIWRTPDGKQVVAPVTGLTPCTPKPSDNNTFEAPPVIQPGAVQVVRGAFDGDSKRTTVKIGEKSCNVIAESPRSAYIDVPSDIPKGETEMTVEENGRGAKIPICALTLGISADKLTLKSGEKTKAHYVISGPEDLPASAWRAGVANELIDTRQLAALDKKGRFPKKGEEGKLLVTIVSSGSIKMKGGENNTIVKWLDQEDFEDGPYKEDVDLQATAPGGFGLTVTAYSFLAPVEGEPFTVPTEADFWDAFDQQVEEVSDRVPASPATSPTAQKLSRKVQEALDRAKYFREKAEKARQEGSKEGVREGESQAAYQEKYAERWKYLLAEPGKGIFQAAGKIQEALDRAKRARESAAYARKEAAAQTTEGNKEYFESEARQYEVDAIRYEFIAERLGKNLPVGLKETASDPDNAPADPCQKERQAVAEAEEKLYELLVRSDELDEEEEERVFGLAFENLEEPVDATPQFGQLNNKIIEAREELDAARKALEECMKKAGK